MPLLDSFLFSFYRYLFTPNIIFYVACVFVMILGELGGRVKKCIKLTIF